MTNTVNRSTRAYHLFKTAYAGACEKTGLVYTRRKVVFKRPRTTLFPSLGGQKSTFFTPFLNEI